MRAIRRLPGRLGGAVQTLRERASAWSRRFIRSAARCRAICADGRRVEGGAPILQAVGRVVDSIARPGGRCFPTIGLEMEGAPKSLILLQRHSFNNSSLV